TDTGAANVVTQIAAADPSIQIFATAGLAESSFVNPAHGGVPYSVDNRLTVTAAAGDPNADYPEAGPFWKQYRAHYGHAQLVAIDGYEAMDLLLASIRSATDGGRQQ